MEIPSSEIGKRFINGVASLCRSATYVDIDLNVSLRRYDLNLMVIIAGLYLASIQIQ